MENIPGAAAAAYEYGAKYSGIKDENGVKLGDIKVCGITRIDLIKQTDKDFQIAQKLDDSSRKTFGYLNKQETIQHIDQLLTSIPTVKVTFKNEKCIKCGIIGDKRFIPTSCHTAMESIHPQKLEFIHPNLTKKVHANPNNLEKYHPGVEKYHNGSYSTSYGNWYHYGSVTSDTT